MREHISNTNWGSVAMSGLKGAADGVTWMYRLIVLGCLLFLVTVQAGGAPQQQLEIVAGFTNGGVLVVFATAAVATLEDFANQHGLKLPTEVDA